MAPRVKLKSLNLKLPFGIGSTSVAITDDNAAVAWELYVEYATRIATQRLAPGTGWAREALNSLYSLFGVTRKILRKAGPSIARSPNTIGPLAIEILNVGLRPFLAEWHTKLTAFEVQATKKGEPVDERQWKERGEFDAALSRMQEEIIVYTKFLAAAAGVARSGT